MDYNGWKLFDKIILIAKQKDKNGFEQAYVVEYGNASQKQTALDWAKGYHGSKRDYNEYTFDNQDFEVELYNSAGGSSQGGRLSFWDCLIRKDGHTFRIGINSDYLLELLRTTTIINGIVQEKVFFARNNGRVGLLHKGMKEYKEALKDMQYKKSVRENKTKNHIRGHAYSSLTLKNVYVGEIYKWIEEVKDKGWYHHQYKLLDKPKKQYIFVDESYIENKKEKSISDFLKAIIIKDKDNWSSGYVLFERTVAKLPERVDDGLMLVDDFNETILQQSIDKYNSGIIETEMNSRPYNVKKSLFYSASKDVKPNVTKEYVDRFKAYHDYDEIIYDESWFEGSTQNNDVY